MVLQVEVELTGIEGLKKSQVNNAMKRAMFAMGLRWRRKYLPFHFEEFGERKYKFARRSRRYERLKKKIHGHTHDLVASGEGKRLALSGRRKVFATRDKVRIPLPRKYNLRPTKSKVRMADEIRRVTKGEVNSLTKFLVVQIDREISKEAGQGPSRVKSASITDIQ